MKTTLSLLVLTTIFWGGLSANEPEKPKRDMQLLFKVRIFKGNPQGSEENGTMKVVAEPTLVTTEHHPCTLCDVFFPPKWWRTIDGQVLVPGTVCRCLPGTVEDGRLPLKLELTHTKVLRETKEETELASHIKHTKMKLKLGEVTSFQLSKPGTAVDRRYWIEFTVTEIPVLEES